MTKKINPITLDQFVDLVKPEKGVCIYRGHSRGDTGNEFSDWGVVERNALYLLSKLGVPAIAFNQETARGEYASPFNKQIEAIQEALDQNNPKNLRLSAENIKSYENKLKKLQDAKKNDDAFIESIEEEGTGLWLAGCFCCLPYNGLQEMAKKFEKGKSGILVPRDHYHLDLYREQQFNKFGGDIDHFLFVAPELSE